MCPERSSASSRSRLSWRRADPSGSIGVPLLLLGRRPLRRMPQPGGFGETDPIPQLQGHCRANRSTKSRSSSEPQEQRTPQRAASLWARKGPEPAWAQTAAREEPRLRRTGREQLGAGVGDPARAPMPWGAGGCPGSGAASIRASRPRPGPQRKEPAKAKWPGSGPGPPHTTEPDRESKGSVVWLIPLEQGRLGESLPRPHAGRDGVPAAQGAGVRTGSGEEGVSAHAPPA